jgi:hypothetical protein
MANTVILGSVLTNVSGDFSFNGGTTSANILSLGDSATTYPYARGDGSTATGYDTMYVGGNFTVSGTGKLLTDSAGGTAGNHTNIITINGNMVVNTGATIDPFGDSGAKFILTGTNVALTLSGTVNEQTSISWTIASNAIVNHTGVGLFAGNGKALAVAYPRHIVIDGSLIACNTVTGTNNLAATTGDVVVSAGGKLYHNHNGTTWPANTTWQNGSLFEITGMTTANAVNSNTFNFYDLTWNSTNHGANLGMGGSILTVRGTYWMKENSSNGVPFEVRSANGSVITNNFNNFTVDNGIYVVVNSGAGDVTINVSNNCTIGSAGRIKMSGASTAIGKLNLLGNFTNNGTLQVQLLSATTGTKITKTGTLTYGGTLQVNTNSFAPTGGASIDFFDASSFAGAFSTINTDTLASGQNWYTGNLTTDGTLLVNRAPTVANPSVSHAAGTTVKVAKSAVTATDADGHTVTIENVSATTTNGVTITSDSTWYYLPTNNVDDAFTYTARDNFGGTNTTGIVSIVVSTATGSSAGNVTLTSSNATAVINGIPGYNYIVTRGTNITFTGTVSNFPTATAGANGQITVIDDFADLGSVPGAAYYRLQYVP